MAETILRRLLPLAVVAVAACALLALARTDDAQAQDAALTVNPTVQTISAGGTFQTAVLVADVAGLQGADVKLSYDASKISVVSYTNGDVLPTEFSPSPLCDAGACNYVSVRVGEAFTGSGTLFTITWQADASGTSAIDILNSSALSDSGGNPVSYEILDGSVVVDAPSGTGDITASVFRDDDRDGDRDAGEPSLAGWELTLYDDLDCIGAVITTAATNDDGEAVFTNLSPSSYSVGETPVEGYDITTPTCVDVILAGEENGVAEFGNALPGSTVVHLERLWNLIDWQAAECREINSAVANLVDAGDLDVVALWLPEPQSWLLFDPLAPGPLNTLDELCFDDIVWIHTDEAVDWVQGLS